jgi:hypothetical protein
MPPPPSGRGSIGREALAYRSVNDRIEDAA